MRNLMLGLLIFVAQGLHAAEPEEILEAYFDVLEQRDFSKLHLIIEQKSLRDLKMLMDRLLAREIDRGGMSLQRRVFGKQVSKADLEQTTARFYLEVFSGEILNAANKTHFIIEEQAILGRVDENDKLAHFVARLGIHQDQNKSSEVFLYTVVKENGEWKLTFPPTFKQILTLLEASVR